MSERPYRITVAETGDRDDRTFRTSFGDLESAKDAARELVAVEGKLTAVESDDVAPLWFIPVDQADSFPLGLVTFAQVVDPAPKPEPKPKRAKKKT